MTARLHICQAVCLTIMWGCGDDGALEQPEYAQHYATHVESFSPGANGGFGDDGFPSVVLGPPQGKGNLQGGDDVLSLGAGGSIVLSFDNEIVDGSGPDFFVFENPFHVGGDPDKVFHELAEVGVSQDGEVWTWFACDGAAISPPFQGCAGWTPTLEYDPNQVLPLEAALVGGDGFDLETIGVQRANYVQIRDLATQGAAPSAGFDLDAVGIVLR